MLTYGYDENRQSPRPPDRAESRGSAADRARGRDRPDRRRRRNPGPGGTAADAVFERPGDRHDDDDRRLSGISGARLSPEPEHAEVRRRRHRGRISRRPAGGGSAYRAPHQFRGKTEEAHADFGLRAG